MFNDMPNHDKYMTGLSLIKNKISLWPSSENLRQFGDAFTEQMYNQV